MSDHEPYGLGDSFDDSDDHGLDHSLGHSFDEDHGLGGLDEHSYGADSFHDDSFHDADSGHDSGYAEAGGHPGDEHAPTAATAEELELPDSLAGPDADGADGAADYPPHLDVAVTPTDGLDWVDPGLLGGEHTDLDLEPTGTTAAPEELLHSLHGVAGEDETADFSWDTALQSDDPAVRSLAAFWHPEAS